MPGWDGLPFTSQRASAGVFQAADALEPPRALLTGLGPTGQLMLPAGAGVGITCATLWSAMGLYAKQQSRAFDRARGIDPASKDGSLGSFNGITYGPLLPAAVHPIHPPRPPTHCERACV